MSPLSPLPYAPDVDLVVRCSFVNTLAVVHCSHCIGLLTGHYSLVTAVFHHHIRTTRCSCVAYGCTGPLAMKHSLPQPRMNYFRKFQLTEM